MDGRFIAVDENRLFAHDAEATSRLDWGSYLLVVLPSREGGTNAKPADKSYTIFLRRLIKPYGLF